MADQWAVVEFDITAGGVPYTVDITSPSITETFSAAILIFSRGSADDTNNPHGLLGVGFLAPLTGASSDSTLQAAVSCSLEDAIGSQDNETERSISQCIRVTDGSAQAALDIVAEYSATISGGVTISVTTADVAAKCTAILFAGLADAAVGNCTFAEGVESHENVGTGGSEFEPDLIITRSSDNTVNTTSPNGTLAIGFALNRPGVPQVSSYVNWDDRSEPSDSDGYIRSDCASSAFQGDRVVVMDRFKVNSFDSTGFNGEGQDDGTGAAQSPQANYLALKFTDPDLNIACANVLATSSTGVQSFNVGIQPSLVFGMSTLMTSQDAIVDGASSAGYFAFTAAKARAYSVASTEAVSTSAAKTRQGEYAVLTLANDLTVAQQATLDSFTATGFDLDFSTATAGYMTVLAIGMSDQTIVQSDTENISDEVLAFLNRALVVSDSIEISDGTPITGTFDVTNSDGPQGVTLSAHAERGTSLQGGPEAGTVL